MITATFAEDGSLNSCRVYWDQATLLKQLGIFHLAFHNLIAATGGKLETTFENGLDQIPIVDGIRLAQRLVHPSEHNGNLIIPLDILERELTKEPAMRSKLAPSIDSMRLIAPSC